MYCLHFLSYPDSLIHLWYCAVLSARVAVVASRPVSLLWEVTPKWNARASNFALRRHVTMSVWSTTVGKEDGLFTCRTKHAVSRISVTCEANVMASGQSLHDTYLIRTSQRTRRDEWPTRARRHFRARTTKRQHATGATPRGRNMV